MKIPKKGKCDNCTTKDFPVNRPVVLGEPTLENSYIENELTGSVHLDVEIPITCEECDSEIGRINFTIEDYDIPSDANIEWDNE